MDSLSVTAGILNIVSLAVTISSAIRPPATSQEKDHYHATKLEIEMYSQILKELGETLLSRSSELPKSAKISLQLCRLHMSRLEHATKNLKPEGRGKVFSTKQRENLQMGLKDFRRSVKIFRDIVTDPITWQTLNAQAPQESVMNTTSLQIHNIVDMSQDKDMVEKQVETLVRQLGEVFRSRIINTCHLSIETIFTDRMKGEGGISEDDLAMLRRAAEAVATTSMPAQSPSNPFEFFANIIRTTQLDQDAARVCAKLDTGSGDNWISHSVVRRVELQESIVLVEANKLYSGAGGDMFQPMGMISIAWTRNSSKSWQTDFLVIENAPFDMILGREFIIKEGLFVFADPVLVTEHTRLLPLSREEYHRMEVNMRQRGAENEELSKTREARDAAARARRRAEKTASRMSLAGASISLAVTPGTITPSSSQPTSSLQSQPPSQSQSSSATAATRETGESSSTTQERSGE